MIRRFPKDAKVKPSPGKWITLHDLQALELAGTTAHRLYAESDGWIERFGEDLLFSYKDDATRDTMQAGLTTWAGMHSLTYRRVFGKLLPKQNEERVAPILLSGDTTIPLETVVTESHLKFGIDFAAGYSAGLFIDQRANRAFVRRSRVQRLLNTFAYTCSFSVAAAAEGAETVSVDLSKRSLDRGRENFALNGLDQSQHRFLADDVMDVLPRLARRGETFDCIILDPPTFSRGNKGRRFQVEKDLEHLLLAALELSTPKAKLLLSTNCTRLDRRALEGIGRHCLKLIRRSGDFHTEPPLPDIPAELGAQALWLVLR